MAYFTNEYIHYTAGACAVGSCRVGDSIWLVQQFFDFKFKMEIMNIYTEEWETIDFKNRHLIEIHNRETIKWNRAFSIFSSDGHIYMWQESLASTNILRFDTVTYEWKMLLSGMPKFWEFQNSVVVNNKVYGNSLNENLIILDMDTLLHRIEPFYDVAADGFKKVNLCEMNGLLYIIRVKQCGTRLVYCQDEITKTYISINEGVDQRDYLTDSWYGSFVWSYNNKLYHALFYENDHTLIIDCFDMETKCFTTIFDSDKVIRIWEKINSISGTDKKIYVTFEDDDSVAVQIIDLKPRLETLSLMSLVKNTSNDKVDIVRNLIPSGLRTMFDNLFAREDHRLTFESESDTDSDSDME